MLKDKTTQRKGNSESFPTDLNNLPQNKIRWLTSLYLTSALARLKATPDVNLSVRTSTVISVDQPSWGGNATETEKAQIIPTSPAETTDLFDVWETLQVPTPEYPVNLVTNQMNSEDFIYPLDDAISRPESTFNLGIKNNDHVGSSCADGTNRPGTVSENFGETLCLKHEDSIEGNVSFNFSVSCTAQGQRCNDVPMNVPGVMSTENLVLAVRHDHLSYVESDQLNTFPNVCSDSETSTFTMQTAEICSSNSVFQEIKKRTQDCPLTPALHPISLVKNQLHNNETLSLDDGCSVSTRKSATRNRKTKRALKKEPNKKLKESLLLKCHLCSTKYCKRSNLFSHIRRIHMATRPVMCSVCNMELKTPASFHRHQLLHLGLRPFSCKSCPKTFINETSLKSHQTQVHKQEKEVNDPQISAKHLVCDVCNVAFISPQDRKEHSAVHTGETPFVCKKCPKAFSGKRLLEKHEDSHAEKTPFVCQVCNREFSRMENLTAHKPFHVRKKAIMCGVCGRSLSGFKSILPHQRVHTGEKPFSCAICHKTFRTYSILHTHKKTHSRPERPHVCETCNKAFITRQSLQRHQIFHSGERPHVCEFCNKAFAMKYDLHLHRKRHTGDKTFKCSLCDRAYVSNPELNRHVRKIHTGDYPRGSGIGERRICDICGKIYPNLTSFTYHMKVHSGVKDHLCSVCGKAFYALGHLRIHEMMHTSKNVHRCGTCGKRCRSKEALKKHDEIQHS